MYVSIEWLVHGITAIRFLSVLKYVNQPVKNKLIAISSSKSATQQ